MWIDPANARRLIEALGDFGFGSLGLTEADFAEPGVIVQLGHPPKRIDLLTSIDGVEFEACWRNRVHVEMGGLAMPVIDADDLVANERASGRLQDLADVEALEGRHTR